MSWGDHDTDAMRERFGKQSAEPPKNEAREALVALAKRYNAAAGEAFADGRDKDATNMRDAAEKLKSLALHLPTLPA